jgi:hypothetical protein
MIRDPTAHLTSAGRSNLNHNTGYARRRTFGFAPTRDGR